MKKSFLLALVTTLLISSIASAYVIKLKDGSLIFARIKYTVKGDRAIITLENGTVTAMKLDQIDVEGSDKYNAENFGNVVAIDTPEGHKPTPIPSAGPAAPRLQDYIKDKKPRMGLPREREALDRRERARRFSRSTPTSSPRSRRSSTAPASRSTG